MKSRAAELPTISPLGVRRKNMKRRHMNSVAKSLCDFLMSRNNDIAGFWGIGVLCRASLREKKKKFSFKVRPGEVLRIYSYEISDSLRITEKLEKHNLDSIEGRMSFFEDGRYPTGEEKYTCGIAIAVTQDGRTGMNISHVECWPHNPAIERRSSRYTPISFRDEPKSGIIQKIKSFIGGVEQVASPKPDKPVS